MQTDPVGYKDGLNWYDYVHNDPVNKTDPTGDDAAAALGVLFDVGKLDGVEEAAGLGPENLVADGAVVLTTAGGLAYAGYKFFQPAQENGPTVSEARRPGDFSRGTKKDVRKEQPDCGKCGRPTTSGKPDKKGVKPSDDRSEIHHKKPIKKGGTGDKDNAENLCRTCHLEEHKNGS